MYKNIKKIMLLLLVICQLWSVSSVPLPLPFNEYSYIMARNMLKKTDQVSYPQEGPLQHKEKAVDIYFEKLKIDELNHTNSSIPSTTKYFYPSRPIESEINKIFSSSLYSRLKLLPKGGNLHMHEGQMLNRRKLLQMVKDSTEYDMLFICDKINAEFCKTHVCDCQDYYLSYFKKVNASNPDGWLKVKDSNWSIEAIVNKTTLVGILNEMSEKIYPTDSAARWDLALKKGLFGFYADLLSYNKTRFDYLKACLDDALSENVQLIEYRHSTFTGLYTFDQNGDRLMNISPDDELKMLETFKRDYIEKNEDFINFLFIIYGSRRDSKEVIRSNLDNAIQVQKDFPDLIRGFDLVGEEDLGHTLLFHSETLIQGFNYNFNSAGHSFGFDFHAGETNWPSDMNMDKLNDDTSTLNNIFDSIVFKSHRIGHGLGFFKHPKLYDFLKQSDIAIEVCPASNQILGYVPDVRNHPAINYFKSGVPIIIGGDDPGSFGYNELTFDFYLIFMAWDLRLYDLKEIANNSIRYSLSPDSLKLQGYSKFQKNWSFFVNSTYDIACDQFKDASLSDMKASSVYPSYGPKDTSIRITIYGYNFVNSLCKRLHCSFNKVVTHGFLNRLNEIVCDSPLGFANNETAKISVIINNQVFNTGLRYRFVSSNLLLVKYDHLSDAATNLNKSGCKSYLSLLFLVLILTGSFCFVLKKIYFKSCYHVRYENVQGKV